MQYIYNASGSAVGFIKGKYIHAMNGQASGTFLTSDAIDVGGHLVYGK